MIKHLNHTSNEANVSRARQYLHGPQEASAMQLHIFNLCLFPGGQIY